MKFKIIKTSFTYTGGEGFIKEFNTLEDVLNYVDEIKEEIIICFHRNSDGLRILEIYDDLRE